MMVRAHVNQGASLSKRAGERLFHKGTAFQLLRVRVASFSRLTLNLSKDELLLSPTKGFSVALQVHSSLAANSPICIQHHWLAGDRQHGQQRTRSMMGESQEKGRAKHSMK
eukprot:1157768-Pelagomonas_calceolata.AAC.10